MMTTGRSRSYGVTYAHRKAKRTGIATLAAFACLVGTGGEKSPEYYMQREERGYPFSEIDAQKPLRGSTATPTFVQSLEFVKGSLSASVSGLAFIFGVSRQTIYDWQNGAKPSAVFEAKLLDLVAAANVFISAEISMPGQLLKRPIREGKSLLDICHEGGGAAEAARELVSRMKKDQSQQLELTNRLAKRVSNAVDADFGAPSLSEHG